ncbi:MAG: hypothetical protein ACM3ZU_08215 [Bacteroidota bacterium]
MPIHGISDVRRLPRLGKVRLGIKDTSPRTGNEFPRAVDFFVVKPDESTSEAAAEAFHQVYGDKPKSLDIMFPVEDKEQFFAQFYRRYGSGSGLLCKGDGATAMEIDRGTGEIREIECNPAECEWAEKKHCRPIGTLQFLLYRVPGLGVWQVDTSSYNSIVNINSAIDFIRAITGGRIAMIPLKLVVRPKEVQVEGKKKVVHVMDIAHDGLRLEDVLRASRTPLAGLLMPGVNLDEVPDDLYPASVVKASQEATKKATRPAPAPEPASDTIDTEAEAVDEEPAPEPDPRAAELEAEIQQGFKALGFTAGKATAWRHKYQNPEELLKALRAEADRVAARQQRSPAPKTGQTRPNLRPVPSQFAPKQPQPEVHAQAQTASKPAQRAFF